MRFGVKISLSNNFIPFNYRRHFLSLIKEAIKNENEILFEKYYGDKKKNISKSFTFSVSFTPKRDQPEKGKIYLEQPIINFYFSAYYPEDLITVYNGFMKLRGKKLNYLEGNIKFEKFFYKFQRKINENKVTFKTLSPILVRDIKHKKGKGFIDYSHSDFKENLFFNVKSMANRFLNFELKKDDFKIIEMKFSGKKVNLYGKEIANKGIITIQAPVKVLQLIYDAGIGAKRSQGWGMLEVVK